MAWPTPVANAITRLLAYIGTRYDAATNPYGLAGDGYKTNLSAAFNDMGTVADAVGQAATDVATIKSDVQAIAEGIAGALADDVPVSPYVKPLLAASTQQALQTAIGVPSLAEQHALAASFL